MQVLTTKARAWNWLTNTADGVKMVYYEKLDIALQHWQDVKDANPDATKWTAKQLEDSAVGKYGPHAGVGWYWNWNDAPDKKKWEPTSHAGFEGPLQLELCNHGPVSIRLTPGMPICQLIFEMTLGTPAKGYSGIFLRQKK